MDSIGLDIGYSSTKAVYNEGRFKVSSIVGSFEDWFAVNDNKEIVEIDGEKFLVGEEAIDQSQVVERREDRGWIKTSMYKRLLEYALTRCVQSGNMSGGKIYVVSGLPLRYFNKDAEYLKGLLLGDHKATINGVESYFQITGAKVIPQSFGVLLSYALNDVGGIIPENAKGRKGVIDVGGKTTNILSVNDLEESSRETTSVNVGGWTLVRKLTDYLVDEFADIDDGASNIEKILVDKSFIYYGEKVDLSEPVSEFAHQIAQQIGAEISQRWGSASHFEDIIIAGGGAHLIGDELREVLPQAFVVNSPVYANAVGFYKFAKRSN